MRELHFIINESEEGGFMARALECSIFTEGETEIEIKKNIKEAIIAHFDEDEFLNLSPIIKLHFTKDEILTIVK